ncbi:MAG: hypothetical protein AAGF20_03450 [Pseudomonadota bacterium]
MLRVAALLALGLVSACGSAQGEMAGYKQQAIDATPTRNAIAASNTFYFCKPHPRADRYAILCEICDVTVHKRVRDNEPDSLIVYAGVVQHDLKARDRGEIKISRSKDRIENNLRSAVVDVETAKALFSEANEWCQAQANGEFQILKDEIDAQLGSEG